MPVPDDEPILEQLADLLPSYDEALRDGTPLPPDRPDTDSGMSARLRLAQNCLCRLRTKWPGPGSPQPGEATPSGDRREEISQPEAPARKSLPGASGWELDFGPAGTRLGRFEIIRPLGRGGHGIVFLARDPALRREVALKVARPETFLDPDLHGRLRREAEAAASLDHPNLVPIYELGQSGPWVYLVSAYCPGPNLAAWLEEREEPVPVATPAELVAALADAVAYMHSRGVLHRDIKPSNVLLVSGELSGRNSAITPPLSNPHLTPDPSPLTPKLTDFGLAKLKDDVRKTQTGAILGTPAYMSPEQAGGQTRDLGPACDVYGLGVLLYEMLTGRPPFQGETAADILRQVTSEEPISPRRLRPGLSRDLESVCLKCLEKRPERRYASATALADDLRRFLNGQATRARPLTAWRRGWRGLLRRRRLVLGVSASLALLGAVVGVGGYVAGLQDSAAALSTTADATRQERDRLEAETNASRSRVSYARAIRLWGACEEQNQLSAALPAKAGPEALRGFEWHLLHRLAHAEWFVGRGHTQILNTVAFSPDGQLCASAGRDRTIIVWDLARRRPRWRFTGHRPDVNIRAVAFSPDGKTLASGGCGGAHLYNELKLWDVATGTQRDSLPVPRGQMIECLAFSPDGRTLATCGETRGLESKVHLLDLGSGHRRSMRLEKLDLNYSVPTLAFSPDGKRLAVGSGIGRDLGDNGGAIHLLDLATGTLTAKLTGHKYPVDFVAFRPDGKSLVSGDMGQVVKVWDLATNQVKLSWSPGYHAALAADGVTLAAAYGSRGLLLWNVATGQWITRVGNLPSNARVLRFGPSGSHLAVACEDGTMHLFDARTIHDLPAHRPAEAWAVAFSPDGKTLASAGDDKTIRLWSMPAFKQLRVLRGHTSLIASVAFSPDGKTLASGGFDHNVRLWDPATGQRKITLRSHTQEIRRVAFSPDGRFLATAARTMKKPAGELFLWELATGQKRASLRAHGNCFAFSGDSRLLAFRDDQDTVKLLDLSTGTETKALSGSASVNCVAFSPDSKVLATADQEGLLKFWDVKKGTELEDRRARAGGELRALVFSSDGKTLASAGMDKTIVLWQAATGLKLLTLKNLPDYCLGLAFSPDSRILAAACHDGTVRVYQGTNHGGAEGPEEDKTKIK